MRHKRKTPIRWLQAQPDYQSRSMRQKVLIRREFEPAVQEIVESAVREVIREHVIRPILKHHFGPPIILAPPT